jgi:hypothetical protein
MSGSFSETLSRNHQEKLKGKNKFKIQQCFGRRMDEPGSSRFKFKVISHIPKSRAVVWNHMTDMEKINSELWWLTQMTFPQEKRYVQLPKNKNEVLRENDFLFPSVVLLFGFIPIDYIWVSFTSSNQNEFCQEHSTSLFYRFWRHRRSMWDHHKNNEVILVDEIHFLPRIYCFGYVFMFIVQALMDHRHKRLQALYGQGKND